MRATTLLRVEAAALGNAIVQGVVIGAFASLEDGRAKIGGTGGGFDD